MCFSGSDEKENLQLRNQAFRKTDRISHIMLSILRILSTWVPVPPTERDVYFPNTAERGVYSKPLCNA